ncbi:MAG: hypothetical protein WBA12_00330 [Catalinimonas sp.]
MSQSTELHARLDTLERRLRRLADEHRSLRKELGRAQGENEKLRGEVRKQQRALQDFKSRTETRKIVPSVVTDGPEAAQLRRRLDDYIREIDNCLAYLSQSE